MKAQKNAKKDRRSFATTFLKKKGRGSFLSPDRKGLMVQMKGKNFQKDAFTPPIAFPALGIPIPWSYFWKVVIRRFALRGAVAAALTAVDGPLPIGDLIAAGMALWMIIEIITLFKEIVEEAILESCIDKYAECSETTPYASCDDCLHYCRAQGKWPYFRCP